MYTQTTVFLFFFLLYTVQIPRTPVTSKTHHV